MPLQRACARPPSSSAGPRQFERACVSIAGRVPALTEPRCHCWHQPDDGIARGTRDASCGGRGARGSGAAQYSHDCGRRCVQFALRCCWPRCWQPPAMCCLWTWQATCLLMLALERGPQSDFGYNDVGYHQSTPSAPKPHPANPRGEATTDAAAGVMPTPTLDQLASEGTKLEMYYVQPLCSPTRATFMTGRYPFHTGLGPDVICTSCGDPYGLPSREILMPALLREAGYTTAAIGKCVHCTDTSHLSTG